MIEKNKSQSVQLLVRSTDLVNRLVEADGEITPELEDLLKGLELDVVGYADRVKFVIDELDSYSEKIAQRIKAYQSAKKALDNHKEGLAERVKYVMQSTNITEAKGQEYTAKVSVSPYKLIIDDEQLIPMEYKIISYELDRALIKNDLTSGKKIDGVHLETGLTLRWSVSK